MINIGLCDDEPAELDNLGRLISDYGEKKELSFDLSRFQGGEEILASLAGGQRFDIIFLDIYMGSTDGISIARKVREFDTTCGIIFATNSRNHAIDGYGVHALHYLLKPIIAADVVTALDRAMDAPKWKKDRCLQIQNREGVHTICIGDILFAESSARVITIHIREQESLRYYDRLDNFALLCDDERFLRCHKSFLVNLDYVNAIVGNRARLMNGEEIPVSMNTSKAKEIFAFHATKSI